MRQVKNGVQYAKGLGRQELGLKHSQEQAVYATCMQGPCNNSIAVSGDGVGFHRPPRMEDIGKGSWTKTAWWLEMVLAGQKKLKMLAAIKGIAGLL